MLALGACQAFFTTSLANWAVRPALAIPADISADQALAYLEQAQANNDPALAAALTPILLTQLQAEGLEAAAAAELSTALLDSILISSGASAAFSDLISLISAPEGEDLPDLTAMFEAVAFTEADYAAIAYLISNPVEAPPVDQLVMLSASLMLTALADIELSPEDPDYMATLMADENYMLALALTLMIPVDAELPFDGMFDGLLGPPSAKARPLSRSQPPVAV
ncbi:MAG: hypothetical protein A2087_11535 [Spirochaetes bacterium GWD1_61_31]|nr:MAG: hypothetical protein A2Y37_14765 [Spirochaetes bacterium GWB1_60_80]OHD29325.1 MAG: hypothetical protein A2004_08265 [Spirochaetes bacterium GWC1_61_12]OHD35833.1 MAG: hypothetical protein A2087_11535 [Spirochaetes bacterium GWD1_61_31]OHD46774.1 MAG: hypothetical protein A2Y35_10705 [Spirochaetes bacterium GWE1_60_18]HAP43016.1 hypothetical protein [Spirochaetaceae bacterium]